MQIFKFLVYERNSLGVQMKISKDPMDTLIAGFMEREQAEGYKKQRQENSRQHITYYIKDVETEG